MSHWNLEHKQKRSHWRQHEGRLETSQAVPRTFTGTAPSDTKRLSTPRRDGPGPYVRGAHGIKNLTPKQIADFIASHAAPFGFNRAARRHLAWQHRTVKGGRVLQAIAAAQRLGLIEVQE